MHMRIAIAGDHNGVALKARLVAFLTARGHKLDDRGTHDPEVVVDYPRLCEDVCRQVVDGQVDRGIMIGGTGGGAVCSVCSATGTSQYSACGRHSWRYLAAEVACEASWPGTTRAGTGRRSRSSGSGPGTVSRSNSTRAIPVTR